MAGTVLYERDGAVARVTMNRPQYGNAQSAGPPLATTAARTMRSNCARYMRCHGRKYHVECWHSFHGAPAGGVTPARPWMWR